MNAVVSCMRGVPIFWRDLFYKKDNDVDNPLPIIDESLCDSLIDHDFMHTLVDVQKLPDKLYVDLPDLPNFIVEDILVDVQKPPGKLYVHLPDLPDSIVEDTLVDVQKPPGKLYVDLPDLPNSIVEDTLVDVQKPPGKLYVYLPDIPNSIVEDILSRLPPNCIFQCQRHSKALHALTKTSYFAQMQRNRPSNSVTVVQRFPDSDCDSFIELYFINAESHNIERKTTDIGPCYKSKNNPISIVGSYDGFLLFTNLNCSGWSESVYYLWNPVTNEKMTWSLSNRDTKYVSGFYFCYVRKEYVLLLVSMKLSIQGFRYEVQIINIITKVRKNVGNCSYPPSRGRSPVIINRTLYWMVDQVLYGVMHHASPCHSHLIVSFEMETEKFIAVGHSGRIGKSFFENGLLHLIELEGELCLCDPISLTEIELSVLNQKTKCWEKRHTVILPMCDGNEFWWYKNNTRVIHYKKGELLVRHMNTLYTYNLHLCSCRTVEIGFADNTFQATVHVDSLVSFEGMDNIIFD